MKLNNFVIYHQIGKFSAQFVLSPIWLKEIMGICSPVSNAPNTQPHSEHDSPVTKPDCDTGSVFRTVTMEIHWSLHTRTSCPVPWGSAFLKGVQKVGGLFSHRFLQGRTNVQLHIP